MNGCKHLCRTIVIGFVASCIIFWIPFFIVRARAHAHTIGSITQAPKSEAALIFGAHLTERGDITPLLQERLDTGVMLLRANKVNILVVSNTYDAANAMAAYLESRGVDREYIEIDAQAETTPDTCAYEKQRYPEERSLLFVSQRFHLPRILLQCKQMHVIGIAVPAELAETIDRSQYSLRTIITTRMSRYIREAGLIWLSVLRLY